MGAIHRRILFWIWIAVFAALTAWWIFYLPYDRAALFRAVPGNASLVATQTGLGRRWRELLDSPPGKVAAEWLPATVDPRTAADSPAFGRVLRFVAPRRTVIAYTHALGPGGPPAWTAASWIGGRALALRWRRLPEVRRAFRRVRTGAGGAVWISREPLVAARWWGSFAVFDGVLLACLSPDPLAVRHLLPLQHTPVPRSPGALDLAKRSTEDGDRLRVWMRPPLPDVPAHASWRFEFDALTSAEAEGRWTVAPAFGNPWRQAGSVAAVPDVPALEAQALQLLGHRPAALLLARYELLAGLMQRGGLGGLDAGLRTNVAELAANPPCFAALLGGDDSGRLLGLRVPTLLAGLRLDEPAAVVENADAILDALNAGEARGLIPRREEAAGRELVLVDSTRPGLYRTMKPAERPAAAALDNWLLVSSNADVLKRVLQRQPAPPPGAAPAIWRPANLPGRPEACLRTDVRRAARALIDVAAVAKLSLGISDAPDTAARRTRLDQTLTLLHTLEPLGTCTFWLTPTANHTAIDFRLRPALESP